MGSLSLPRYHLPHLPRYQYPSRCETAALNTLTAFARSARSQRADDGARCYERAVRDSGSGRRIGVPSIWVTRR